MYTLIPFRGRRDVGRSLTNNLFNDSFFRSFFDMSDWMGSAGFRVDVKDKADHYLLEAELPGVSEDQIDLTVDNDVLTITANARSERKEEKDNYLYCERRAGRMERSFSLEGIQQDNISADYKNGMLTVTLPKNAPEQPKTQRKIAIGGNGQGRIAGNN